jgi:hypothetical protein
MKNEQMDANEYPDFIQADAKGGEIVEYVRVNVAKDREKKLIAYIRDISKHALPCDAHIYKRVGLEELK